MSKKSKAPQESSGILIVANNKQAYRDYEILSTLEAGLVLKGSEVKSIREGGLNIKEGYVRPLGSELFLVGCHIKPYSHMAIGGHEAVADRKLLLHRKEIERLETQVAKKGLTLIPLKVYFKKGICKLEVGVGRGKKLHDKREDVKAKETRREIERAFTRNKKGK